MQLGCWLPFLVSLAYTPLLNGQLADSLAANAGKASADVITALEPSASRRITELRPTGRAAVGDTPVFCVDKLLYIEDGQLVEDFTRVEAFGSPKVHSVRVRGHAFCLLGCSAFTRSWCTETLLRGRS